MAGGRGPGGRQTEHVGGDGISDPFFTMMQTFNSKPASISSVSPPEGLGEGSQE